METLQSFLTDIDVSALLSGATVAIGALAFLVSAITQVTKGLGFLNKIPTNIQVTVLSLVLTILAYFAMNTFLSRSVTWYELVAAFIVGFIVSFVATYGWEQLHTLWNRFKKPTTDSDSTSKDDTSTSK